MSEVSFDHYKCFIVKEHYINTMMTGKQNVNLVQKHTLDNFSDKKSSRGTRPRIRLPQLSFTNTVSFSLAQVMDLMVQVGGRMLSSVLDWPEEMNWWNKASGFTFLEPGR